MIKGALIHRHGRDVATIEAAERVVATARADHPPVEHSGNRDVLHVRGWRAKDLVGKVLTRY